MMSVEESVRHADTLEVDLGDRPEEFTLRNSVVVAEYGPAGLILRVEKGRGRVDYAGPFMDPVATLAALSQVEQ